MITQRARILNNTTTTLNFKAFNLFSDLSLNNLTSYPAFVTEILFGGYIDSLDCNPTATGEYYIYFTLGGSPPTEDALLIIEVVDSLTDDIDSCVGMYSYLIDTVSSNGGKVQINSLYDFSTMPKVNEYVYIPNSIYAGYHRVYNAILPSTIILDLTYITTITPSTHYIYTFNNNTSVCLVWINREGGRSSMIFDQRKDYGLTAGDTKTFDNNTTVKYINRGKNFDNTTLYKSGITQDEVLLIESLRTSIQVWEYDINTNVSTPVVVDSNSFPKFNTKNPFNEVSFKYRIANYKTIQNQ